MCNERIIIGKIAIERLQNYPLLTLWCFCHIYEKNISILSFYKSKQGLLEAEVIFY